jgi:hypothetical protein
VSSSSFSARQDAEEISRHSEKKLGKQASTYATVKTGWLSLNVVIFPLVLRLVLEDPKQ